MIWLKRIGLFLAIWLAVMLVASSLMGLALISFPGEAEVMSLLSLIIAGIITARLIARDKKPLPPTIPDRSVGSDIPTAARDRSQSRSIIWLKRFGVFFAVWLAINLVGSVITSTILYIYSGGDPGDAALKMGMKVVAVLSIIVAFATTGPITARLMARHQAQG